LIKDRFSFLCKIKIKIYLIEKSNKKDDTFYENLFDAIHDRVALLGRV